MTDRPDILISARDARALSLMLGNSPRQHCLEEEAAEALAITLSAARIVGVDQVPEGVVMMGSTVTYVDSVNGGRRVVTIAYPAQADASAGRVSVLSPIGRALLGRSVGSVIDVVLPTGRPLAIRIVDVKRRSTKDEEALALA
jgi:regulator of nucleoside diphosphate kinase